MANTTKLVKRHQKVAYYGVPGASGGAATYHKMTKFTALSTAKNSKEYSRQYVEEAFESTDVTGYSPSMSYAFDQYKNNPVHDDIISITDNELTGDDAVREIILVDLTSAETGGKYAARKRSFPVIPDSEGDGTDAYTYSGTFKTRGESINGTVAISESDGTATFTASAN